VRQFEEKAAYSRESVNMLQLARNLTRLGTVVFLSRYKRKAVKDIIVPKEFIDSASLASQADLIVGVGGTITREAALQGTPAIIVEALPKQHVNDFLIRKGFPIFKTKPSSTLSLAKKILGKKYDVKHLLDQLENPVDAIKNIVNKMSRSY
jgi:predicted glycosyltransferase